MAGPEKDINEIMASAVKAQVAASVMEAMASNGTMQAIVVAALQQPVGTGSYDRDKKPLLEHLLQQTIIELTKKVVAEEIAAHAPAIREEVRKAIKKSIGVISDSLVDGFVANASGKYPSIEVKFGGRD